MVIFIIGIRRDINIMNKSSMTLLNHKYILVFMTFISLVLLRYELSTIEFEVSKQQNTKFVYIRINNNKYIPYKINNGDIIELNIEKNDNLKISLLENSTISYFWTVKMDDFNGLQLIEHNKIRRERNNLFTLRNNREGENYDRTEFILIAKHSGEYKLEFEYIPKEPVKILKS